MNSVGRSSEWRTNRRRGFTLVELIVATGITVVLAAMLLSASSSILESWNRSRGKLMTSNQAKLSLDQLSDDLEGLVLRSDGNVWFAATVTGAQTGTGDAGITGATYATSKPTTAGISELLAPASGELADYRFGHAGVWLRFFGSQLGDNANVGKISSIGAFAYQIARIPVSASAGNLPRYFLFRSAVRPGSFNKTGGGLSDSPTTRSVMSTGFLITDNNAYNNPDGTNSGESEPGGIRRPERVQIIGNDVIDFGLRIYVRDSSGSLVERFPVDRIAGGTTPVLSFFATTAASVTPYGTGAAPAGIMATVHDFPAIVEMMIRVLSDEGAQLILALETGKTSPPGGAGNFDTYWWELATAHSSVYTRRIEVKSRPFATR